MNLVKSIAQQKLYQEIDFLVEKNILSSRQTIWHAVKLKHAAEQIISGKMNPHTRHRYWPDGKRRKEDDPLYEGSYWMYGWSMTREKKYAFNWSDVVFELDAEKIAHHFKIEQIAWNNLFSHKTHNKKEYEEFVVAHYEPRSIDDLKQQQQDRESQMDILYDQIYATHDEIKKLALQSQLDTLEKEHQSWMKDWDTPRGKSIDLNECIKGIYLKKFVYDIFSTSSYQEDIDFLNVVINHPKYKGLYLDNVEKKKNSLNKT